MLASVGPAAATAADDPTGVSDAEQVLRRIAQKYYEDSCAYHRARRPDSPERVFWRIRLIVLAEVGDDLAAALGLPSPEWEAMHELAEGAHR